MNTAAKASRTAGWRRRTGRLLATVLGASLLLALFASAAPVASANDPNFFIDTAGTVTVEFINAVASLSERQTGDPGAVPWLR